MQTHVHVSVCIVWFCNNLALLYGRRYYTVVQRQAAVTAHFSSEQLLLFVIAVYSPVSAAQSVLFNDDKIARGFKYTG